jgi:branched-chain amino acid transport system ATP-binding protein
LAPKIVEKIFEILRTIKERGRTILLVEQNAHAALGISSRGYILETGNVALSGGSAQLLQDSEVKAKYLGG